MGGRNQFCWGRGAVREKGFDPTFFVAFPDLEGGEATLSWDEEKILWGKLYLLRGVT